MWINILYFKSVFLHLKIDVLKNFSNRKAKRRQRLQRILLRVARVRLRKSPEGWKRKVHPVKQQDKIVTNWPLYDDNSVW